jgi:hypothetical protein
MSDSRLRSVTPVSERRRAPRAAAPDDERLSLEVSLPVQVLEISLSGVLLRSRVALAVGQQAELRATVGGRSVSLTLRVQRVSVETMPRGGAGYRAAAIFVAMTAEQRVVLEQLLRPEPT